MMEIWPGALLLSGDRGGREQLLLLVQLRVRLKLMHKLSTGKRKKKFSWWWSCYKRMLTFDATFDKKLSIANEVIVQHYSTYMYICTCTM